MLDLANELTKPFAEFEEKLKSWTANEIEKAKLDAEIDVLMLLTDRLDNELAALRAQRLKLG